MDMLTSSAMHNAYPIDCAQDPSVGSNAGAVPRRQWPRRQQSTISQASLYWNFTDLAVLPGQVATPDAVRAFEERKHLLDLVARFQRYGFSQVAGRQGYISAKAAVAACGFIKLLPHDAIMPRVVPDGEGGLAAVWDCLDGVLLVVIDDAHLHVVVRATTPEARYHDQLPFQPDGMLLPAEVLAVLPRR